MLEALVNTPQHCQELGEMDTHRRSGSSANWHSSPESKLEMGVKGLKRSSFSSSYNMSLSLRKQNSKIMNKSVC